MKTKDELGFRMKSFYENRAKTFLPRRTNTIIRIDGKSFHSYTKGLDKPFDEGLIEDMSKTAVYLCENIQGTKMAYVQSDEISILLTDYDNLNTDAWFDANIQKMTSVSASFATKAFNLARLERFLLKNPNNEDLINPKLFAEFDSRTFTIPSTTEVVNYFIWRQKDCIRNSISMIAPQSLYSQKQLNKKSSNEMREMCFQKGVNWNDIPDYKKRGSIIIKYGVVEDNILKNKWKAFPAPEFTKYRNIISDLFPIEYN